MRHSRLFIRYYISCLAIAMTVLLLCGLIMKGILVDRFSLMRESDYTSMLESHAVRLRQTMDSLQTSAIQIQTSPIFSRVLLERYPSRVVTALNYLTGVSLSNPCINSVAVHYFGSDLIYKTDSLAKVAAYCKSTLDGALTEQDFARVVRSGDGKKLILTGDMRDGLIGANQKLLYAYPIPSEPTATQTGVILFVLDCEKVFGELTQSVRENGGFLYVADQGSGYGYIVNGDPSHPLVTGEADLQSVGDGYLLMSIEMNEGITCTLGVSKAPLYDAVNSIWRAALLTLAAICAVSMAAALFLATGMYRPVRSIYRSMELSGDRAHGNEWEQIQKAVDELLNVRDMSFELTQNIRRQIFSNLLFNAGNDETHAEEMFALLRQRFDHPNFVAAILARADREPLSPEQIDAEALSGAQMRLCSVLAREETVVLLFNTALTDASAFESALREALDAAAVCEKPVLCVGSVERSFSGIHASYETAHNAYAHPAAQNRAPDAPDAPVKAAPLSESQRVMIKKMITYIDAHFDSYELSLNMLADMFKITPSYATRLFRESTGYSIKTYIDMKKIEKAKHLLKTTRHSVQAIAQFTGHANTSSFNVKFKKYTGCTPQEYRHL